MDTGKKYAKDRDKAYDSALGFIAARIKDLPCGFVATLHSFSPDSASAMAERECWALYARGIAHLKSGGQGARPGSLHEALSRTSLRNAGLAAGLGIRPPVYESSDFPARPVHKKGGEEALFMMRRLLEAAEADLGLSRRIIASGLAGHNPVEAFGAAGLFVTDPELSKIAKAARLGTDSLVAPQNLDALRRQMVMGFNFLMDSYAAAGRLLREEIEKR